MSKLFYTIRKMLGLSSLMLASMAVFTPVLTIYLIWVSALLAGLAGLTGSLIFSAIALVLNVVNLLFLSPVSLALMGGNLFSMIISLVVFIVSAGVWGFGLRMKFSGLMKTTTEKSTRAVESTGT